MRLIRTSAILLVVIAAGARSAADRQWQTGTWTDVGLKRTPWVGDVAGGNRPLIVTPPPQSTMPEVATYVIETADRRLELQDILPIGRGAFDLDVSVGGPVTFALSKNTAYIRKADGTEYRLRVIKNVRKRAKNRR